MGNGVKYVHTMLGWI